jgi:hypothetical protein
VSDSYTKKYEKRKDDPDWIKPRPQAFNKKKNTRKFCKGKIGKPHIGVMRMQRWSFGVCRVSEYFYYNTENSRKLRWTCNHEEVCANCGKILNWRPDVYDCPTYIEQQGKK